MTLPPPSPRLRSAINSRSASRTQTGQRIRFETHRGRIARQCQHTLHVRLHIVEIERLARTAPLFRPACARRDSGQRFDLLEIAVLAPALQLELLADFEQPDPRLLAPQILAPGLNPGA